MPWISINPNSESLPAVKAAAYIVGVSPETISSIELAAAYNQVEDHHTPLAPEAEGSIDSFVDSISSLLNEEVEAD